MIPWAKPSFWGNEVKYVTEALESTWISGGSYLDKLEEIFHVQFNKKHVLACSNGTAAIHLAYLGLDLKPGDEIIVPGFAFMAAANIALHMGLKPVFAEVDPDTWCLCPKKLADYITPHTKAIVPVHTYGNVCEMDMIMQIANRHGIPVVEDCAESLYSKYNNSYSGVFGKVSTFSFHATKTITTGEGGMVITDSDEIGRKMTLYRSHGMDRGKKFYWHELPGHNFRLTNLQAAIGIAQLEKSDLMLAERKRVSSIYIDRLSSMPGIKLQKFNTNVNPVIWAIAMELDQDLFPQGRDRVIEQMKEAGIETRPGFYASSFLDIYSSHSLPICENISRSVISLPTYPTLEESEIHFICDQLLILRKL